MFVGQTGTGSDIVERVGPSFWLLVIQEEGAGVCCRQEGFISGVLRILGQLVAENQQIYDAIIATIFFQKILDRFLKRNWCYHKQTTFDFI